LEAAVDKEEGEEAVAEVGEEERATATEELCVLRWRVKPLAFLHCFPQKEHCKSTAAG